MRGFYESEWKLFYFRCLVLLPIKNPKDPFILIFSGRINILVSVKCRQRTTVFTMQMSTWQIVPLFSNHKNNSLSSVRSLHFSLPHNIRYPLVQSQHQCFHVYFSKLSDSDIIILLGSAAPRNSCVPFSTAEAWKKLWATSIISFHCKLTICTFLIYLTTVLNLSGAQKKNENKANFV